jgi:hypothetical protein
MSLLPPIFEIATGYWASQAVYVAAKLGIADLLAEGPKSSEEMARATGANGNAICRLLRALASLGVLAHEHHRFHLTEIGIPLRSGVPGSLRSMLLTLGEEHYHAWGRLLHSVKSGEPAFNRVYNAPLFEYLQSNAAAGETFNDAMNDFTRQAALACALAYDFSGIRSAVDVGGGHGALIGTILRCYPAMTGVLFDSATVLEKAGQQVKAAGIEDRCLVVAGNFFESVPQGAGAYLMKNVLHDWDDDSAVTILQNCRRAMGEDAKLLVIEVVLRAGSEESFESLLDLNMLVMSGGRERTEAEYRRLLENGGFQLTRITPTVASVSVIEGVPSGFGA